MKLYKIIIMLSLFINLNPIFSYSESTSENINYNGMNFIIRNNGSDELILTEYTGNDETLVIPENIGEYTVTAIDSEVFKDNKTIKNVTLPDTINYFGSEVFRNSDLVSVNIPKSLKAIPEYSFNNCSELETVVFHDEICLLDYTAFKKTDIEIPSYLHDRGAYGIEESNASCLFTTQEWTYKIVSKNGDVHAEITRYNDFYTEVVVPDKLHGAPVTEISSFAFYDYISELKSIHYPETITELGGNFSNSPLEEITLPNIDTIHASQFANCKNLKKVNINSNRESLTIENNAFVNCDSLTSIPFSESFKEISIGNNAFKNCIGIQSIPCPETCTNINIGDNAFENTRISEVDFKASSKIGVNAFKDCPELSCVSLNDSYVCFSGFRSCPELNTVTIKGNSTLEEFSFYDCQLLEDITIENLNISMANAISECRNFMSINKQNVFDTKTGDFNKDLKEFVLSNFYGVDDVGFINLYVQAQAEKIVKEITDDNMTDIQKIKAIHDWICKNTVYDDGLSGDRKNHNDASVLMNDSTVCEGYSRIANILYNTAGIETYYISGVGHAWNIVKTGNNYFHVDTTWDDGDKISYDWFMKSDDEMKNSDEYHTSWKTYIPSSLHSFQQGKTLPECSYSMGDVNQDNSINIADMVILNKYILYQDNIDYDSYILSDLTFDGVIDSFDLVKMRQALIK